jgi:NAD(P)-dependent dehydrogenase (short-subunit alcohol dehydrogenase family)
MAGGCCDAGDEKSGDVTQLAVGILRDLRECRERGDNVVLVARGADRLAEAARRCEVLGGRALAVPGDVTDGARMREVVAEAVAAFGRVEASHSRIAVCGVYPAFTDTPTATRSGNYTGRTLRPVPPVVSPERVAAAIVSLAGSPRRARRVGSQHAASAAYAVAPDTVGRIAARLDGWYFRSAGEPSEPADGALFGVRPAPVSGRGGWGRAQRMRARAALAGLAVAAGSTAAIVRSSRR